ncbi:MAG: polyribonucleotide nucleotidyltransferase [Acidobacteria bacterium RIFCSPLOWO2_02_FULL_61_28]|nr:MAG: polyribonucleotide nucleotidyltransferase [Acidobacteria bacterium RIFCSPLOWO2_02_FULL_61_28]
MDYQESIELGKQRLVLETGRLAKQANGSAYVRYGDTVVLATACANQEPRLGINFFPLTVDYREYTYAAGRIPGGFYKREGRPSEKEIVTSRLIDRPVRPLFPAGFACETQVIAMVLSADSDNDPDVISIVGASAALYLSEIPFHTPLGAVRVGLVGGQLVLNPTYSEQRESLLNIVVVGTEDAIVMVEAGAQEVSEETVNDAIQFGHAACKRIVAALKDLYSRMGIQKRTVVPPVVNQTLLAEIEGKWRERLVDALDTSRYAKIDSERRVTALRKELLASYESAEEATLKAIKEIYELLEERIFREDLLKHRRRPDRRAFDAIRKISCDVGFLPRTHGSALFTRGETQALVTATLGTSEDVQRMDVLEGESQKRFMLHYNFPPFSVGEVAFLRGPGRREIGHGALAERALVNMMPGEEVFPYTVRVVSDILESNGSSSMATVCGASLALMDAGVPIKGPVAGIAMGLVLEGDQYAILTDIAGAEDHYGDMDFKVAGTNRGITALQMDIKVGGITPAIMAEALEQARKARLAILDTMVATIPEPRTAISPYAPRIYTMKISTDKIRDVIGPGGKMIRSIIEQTGVKIDVEDDGRVNIASSDESSAKKAIQIIQDLTAVAEIGKTYLGKVVRLVDFGAFVEIFPGTDGLLHISEVAEHRIRDIHDELKEGDQVLVKVMSMEGNKIKLSRKAVLREQRDKHGSTAGD